MELKKIHLQEIKKNRLEGVHLRRNIFYSLTFVALSTALIIFIITTVDPTIWWAKPTFLFLIFIDCFYLFSVIFAKRRRGLVSALFIISSLILLMFGVKNTLLILALFATGLTTELVLTLKKR